MSQRVLLRNLIAAVSSSLSQIVDSRSRPRSKRRTYNCHQQLRRFEILEPRIALAVGDSYAVPNDPRVFIDLTDGWKFQYNASGSPQNVGYNDSAWATVDLPHTWNGIDGQNGGNYAQGNGWYRKTLSAAEIASLAGKTIYIQFEGASMITDLWVDGAQVDFNPVTSEDSHVGGFATFNFDLSSTLSQGASHVLAVRTSNSNFATITPPQAGDFTKYGGIYRDVALIGVDPAHVALRERATTPIDWNEDGTQEVTNTPIATPGFYFEASYVSATSANVQVKTRLDNLTGTSRDVLVRSILVDAEGIIVSEEIAAQTLAPNVTSLEIVQTSTVADPRLWNGRIDPYLYDLYVEIVDAGTSQVIDLVHDRVGIRYFEINPYNPAASEASGFQLNGQDYNLHGVNYHQDARNVGWAKSDVDTLADVQQMLQMGVTIVRTAHYQHSQYFYDLCNEYGIIVYTETAVNGTGGNVPDNMQFFHNSADQLHELIRQNYNHASIIVWGMHNEASSSSAVNQRFMRQMNPLARAEDPTRKTTSNSTNTTVNNYDRLGDSVTMSRYGGWYGGSPVDLASWADSPGIKGSKFPVGVGEYGGGASLYHHTNNLTDLMNDPNNQQWHPENYEAWLHEQLWPIIDARPWLWSTTIWLMYDFGSDHRNEGAQPGINDKGVATLDRETKDAYHFYEANWNDPSRSWNNEKVLYIADWRWTYRHEPSNLVKIYSNLGAPTLSLNGTSQGVMSQYAIAGTPIPNTYAMMINLADGSNRIEVSNSYGGQTFTDDVAWHYHSPALTGSQVARIDFTNVAANSHAGYVADTGQAYGVQGANGTYGWLNAATLAPATNSTGFNDAAGAAPFNEQRYRSAIQLPTNRIWEYELPNGVYDVKVVSADAGFTNMINNINVEGFLLQDDDFVLNAGNPGSSPSHDEFYARVHVADGRLTLSTATGSHNVRLAYIDINRIEEPTLPGDFNQDFIVDAADYTVWRNSLGQPTVNYSGADGNGNGVVDAADYGVWKQHFGMSIDPPPLNDLVLIIDPSTGEAMFTNDTDADLALDAYLLQSLDGAFLPVGWQGLTFQSFAGWEESPPSSQLLAELKAEGFSVIAPQQTISIGFVFDVTKLHANVTLEYSLFDNPDVLVGSVVFASFSAGASATQAILPTASRLSASPSIESAVVAADSASEKQGRYNTELNRLSQVQRVAGHTTEHSTHNRQRGTTAAWKAFVDSNLILVDGAFHRRVAPTYSTLCARDSVFESFEEGAGGNDGPVQSPLNRPLEGTQWALLTGNKVRFVAD